MSQTFWAREDSGTANTALNLTGDPAIEITFVASETSSGAGDGDLFLEQPAPDVIDPDTKVSINGVEYEFVFELIGTLPTTNPNGANQVPDQFEGSDAYVVTVQDYPTAGDTTRFSFLPDEQATQAEMDAFGNGRINLQGLDETPDPMAVCFAQGTRIRTPGGEVCIEDLSVGDLVETRDAGPQPIKWLSRTEFRWPGAPDSQKPILIQPDALGAGRPQHRLVVSPQHCLLVNARDVLPEAKNADRLVPAKALVNLAGIRSMAGKRSVTYFHLMLERHSILFSESVESESFYPGPMAMAMLTATQRDQIHALYPTLRDDPEGGYGPRVCESLNHRRAQILVAQLDIARRKTAAQGTANPAMEHS
ncbi:MAG: Hint domain-containing protein [Litoreibacter sp.]|nr:Hint domain-containing protein [Litoreibacter sp.]